MPKCKKCGAWTQHKDGLCESCAAGALFQPEEAVRENEPIRDVPSNYMGGFPDTPFEAPFSEPAATTPDYDGQVALEEERGVYTGIVANINEFLSGGSAISRWFASLFRGMPFSLRPVSCTFQLQLPPRARMTLQGVGEAVSVHAFLKPNDYAADFSEGNRLRVHGYRGPHNYIYATAIENLSTGTNISRLGGVSCWVIRAITLFLLIGVWRLVCVDWAGLLDRMLSGVTGSVSDGMTTLAEGVSIPDSIGQIIALIIMALVFIYGIKHKAKLRRMVIWILVTLVLGYFSSALAVLSVMVGGLMILTGFLL